jgi:MoaC family
MAASEFTHLDPLGRARMVDVTSKDATHRRAVARCRVNMDPETAAKIASGAVSKGDVLAVSRVAGIQAAKQTPNLLPLCHPLLVGSVYVNFRIDDDRRARALGEDRGPLRHLPAGPESRLRPRPLTPASDLDHRGRSALQCPTFELGRLPGAGSTWIRGRIGTLPPSGLTRGW